MGNKNSQSYFHTAFNHTSITATDSWNPFVLLLLFCFCSPVPEISWRRTSGVPFPSKVKMKNSNAVLEIPNFQQEDAGTYECVAENRRGKNAARGRVSFHGELAVSNSLTMKAEIHRLLQITLLVQEACFFCFCVGDKVFAVTIV